MVAMRSRTQRFLKDGLHQSDQEDDGNTPQPPVTMALLCQRIAQIQKEMWELAGNKAVVQPCTSENSRLEEEHPKDEEGWGENEGEEESESQ